MVTKIAGYTKSDPGMTMRMWGVARDAWIRDNSIINVVLKVTTAANWTKLGENRF